MSSTPTTPGSWCSGCCTRLSARRLSRCLKFDPTRLGHPLRSIQYFERDQISLFVIVENDARFIFVAFGYLDTSLEDDAQRVGSGVVGGLHDWSLQYSATWLVR